MELVDVLCIHYPGIHEDEIHLAEGEDHLQDGIDAPQNLVARRVPWDLKECPQLKPTVYHGSQSKGCMQTIKKLHIHYLPWVHLQLALQSKLLWEMRIREWFEARLCCRE